MKREVKFRGKDIENENQWRCGSLIQYPNGDCVIVEFDKDGNELSYDVDPDTVGQFTGLHDCNGKEIYEGDIVAETSNIIGSIFLSARYGVSIQKNSTTWSLINFCVDSDFDCGTLSDIEVIGNIHDNSELL